MEDCWLLFVNSLTMESESKIQHQIVVSPCYISLFLELCVLDACYLQFGHLVSTFL